MPGLIDVLPPAGLVRAALLALALACLASARALSDSGLKVVSYHGYQVTVPRSWPVYDLSKDPTTCVRFNRHAIYLGRPGAEQRCPAHAAGRTEAILLQPRAHGIAIIATWHRDPALIRRALGRRSLRGLSPVSGWQPGSAAAGRAPLRAAAEVASVGTTPGAVYTGLGFDVCSTPSPSQMSAWGFSSYHAIGVYIGGVNMACAQRNLSAAWVSRESAAGWHLIPIYVGLQAPSNSCGCAAISSSSASSEGGAAAADAVTKAQLLGMGPGNPLYVDMEAYSRGGVNSSAVLAFLQGWTTQAHAEGYKSGVYSSDYSGISDLVSQWGTAYIEPDQIWIANWNGIESTSDANVPPGDWATHQRLHQYSGGHNETHGGVTLNVDGDYVDAPAAAAGSAASAAAELSASSPPTIYGNAVEGQTLSEAHANWPGAPTAYAYQWEDCNAAGTSCVSISDATGQSYTLGAADIGHTIRVIEVASYGGGAEIPAASQATGQVMSAVPLYWLYTAYGNVYQSPGTAWYRSPFANGFRGSSIRGMAATSDGKGYWLVGAAGGVYPYGDAARYRSTRRSRPIKGIVAAPGGGYWLYSGYGNVWQSGTAWYGSPFASGYRGASVAGMAVTADGRGYWLVDRAGRVFAYGDAASYPSPSHAHPIRGIVAAPGRGYWLYTAHGNVFRSPGTTWYGSPIASGFRGPSVAGMAATTDGKGYWLVDRAGSVFAFGDAASFSSPRHSHPITGIAGG